MKGVLAFAALMLFGGLCPAAPSTSTDQSKARTALAFQVSQIGKDCPDAKTTVDANRCLMTVEQKAGMDFADFLGSLRSLLQKDKEAIRQLDASQAQWARYIQTACDAIDDFYRDGTIRQAAVFRCRIQLTRSRMRDLNALYYTTLNN